MKKIGLLVIGGIAALVLVGSVGPLVGLAISLVIMYYAFKGFMKTTSLFKKMLWAVLGLIAFSSAASNFPALFAVAAAFVLYRVVKKWKNQEDDFRNEESDPFINFEKQWADLRKNY